MRKASVLPLPVRAAASTSLPFKETGILVAWISVMLTKNDFLSPKCGIRHDQSRSVTFSLYLSSRIRKLEDQKKLEDRLVAPDRPWDGVVFSSAEIWKTHEFHHCTFQSLNLLLFWEPFGFRQSQTVLHILAWLFQPLGCRWSCLICHFGDDPKIRESPQSFRELKSYS